jgi:hypothetical protein
MSCRIKRFEQKKKRPQCLSYTPGKFPRLPTCFGVLFILFVWHATAQADRQETDFLRDTVLTLRGKMNDVPSVLLVQSDQYIVRTSLARLRDNLEHFVAHGPHRNDDQQLLQLIQAAAASNDEVDGEKIAERDHLLPRLQYRIADLLESGQCSIIDQESHEPVTAIRLQIYRHECGPRCGNGGRRFFINNTLILQVMDWIK